jgi:hypothetical protein
MFKDMNNNVSNTNTFQQPRGLTLNQTDEVSCDSCKNTTFKEAMFLRKASRFITGQPKDSYVPIPVFVCAACGHANDEFIPTELKPSVKI